MLIPPLPAPSTLPHWWPSGREMMLISPLPAPSGPSSHPRHVLSPLPYICPGPCAQGLMRGLISVKVGGGCVTFSPLSSPLPGYKYTCLQSTYLFLYHNTFNHIFHVNIVVHHMPSLWVGPSWGYHTHFVDAAAKAQRGKVTCPEACSW